jgi:hypothetical protein
MQFGQAHDARSIPIRDRHSISVKTAVEFTGLPRTRIYNLLKSGDVEGRVVSGRRIILVKSLLDFLDHAAQPARDAA